MVAALPALKGVKNPLSLPVSKRTCACAGAANHVATAAIAATRMDFMDRGFGGG
jgi:hypothetical protein